MAMIKSIERVEGRFHGKQLERLPVYKATYADGTHKILLNPSEGKIDKLLRRVKKYVVRKKRKRLLDRKKML